MAATRGSEFESGRGSEGSGLMVSDEDEDEDEDEDDDESSVAEVAAVAGFFGTG